MGGEQQTRFSLFMSAAAVFHATKKEGKSAWEERDRDKGRSRDRRRVCQSLNMGRGSGMRRALDAFFMARYRLRYTAAVWKNDI